MFISGCGRRFACAKVVKIMVRVGVSVWVRVSGHGVVSATCVKNVITFVCFERR